MALQSLSKLSGQKKPLGTSVSVGCCTLSGYKPSGFTGECYFPFIRTHQGKQHSKSLFAVSAETFQQCQLVVPSLFHPHSFPGDNPSHTYLTLPNCMYLGQAYKDREVPGPSHGHLEAVVCFGKMQSRVVSASQTSLPEGFGTWLCTEGGGAPHDKCFLAGTWQECRKTCCSPED